MMRYHGVVIAMCTATDETCSKCRAPKCAHVDQYVRQGGKVIRRIVCEPCLDSCSEAERAFDRAHRRRIAVSAKAA
jgi:hypothetical protein